MKKENITKPEESANFEAALSRLDEIVSSLENGSSGLEDSLRLFEEGVGLIRACSDKLEQAEQRVKILVSSKSGEYNEQDFTKTE